MKTQLRDVIAYVAARTYLGKPQTLPLARTIVLVRVENSHTHVYVVDTTSPGFEQTIRELVPEAEGSAADYVIAYREQDPCGMLRVVGVIPSEASVFRFRTALNPGRGLS